LAQFRGKLTGRSATEQLLHDIGVPEETLLSNLVLENDGSCSLSESPAKVRVVRSDLTHQDGASQAPFEFKAHLLKRWRKLAESSGKALVTA
jgi:hypothetical protein